jgi:hypothetical protein
MMVQLNRQAHGNGNGGLTIREVLRGCEVGRMQSVGVMQVIPLLSELEDERFVSPAQALVSTEEYGALVFRNPTPLLLIVPCHVGYVVDAQAQDHAMTHAGFVPAEKRRRFDTAVCIQETEPGLIREDSYRMMVLPYPLREPALKVRHEDSYSRMWPAIGALNSEAGLGDEGNLVRFLSRFQRQLDQFVAEFECVPDQVGAIILIAGHVVGVERGPSRVYFASIWDALIRECYGSQAIRATRQLGNELPIPRARLRDDLKSLADLAEALEEARLREEEAAKATVRDLVDTPFEAEVEARVADFALETLHNDQFIGQVVREGERVCYSSLVANQAWLRQKEWRDAPPFEI